MDKLLVQVFIAMQVGEELLEDARNNGQVNDIAIITLRINNNKLCFLLLTKSKDLAETKSEEKTENEEDFLDPDGVVLFLVVVVLQM